MGIPEGGENTFQSKSPDSARNRLWLKRLYGSVGLPDRPKPEEIEHVARGLFVDVSSAVEGAELILGRELSVDEEEFLARLVNPHLKL